MMGKHFCLVSTVVLKLCGLWTPLYSYLIKTEKNILSIYVAMYLKSNNKLTTYSYKYPYENIFKIKEIRRRVALLYIFFNNYKRHLVLLSACCDITNHVVSGKLYSALMRK